MALEWIAARIAGLGHVSTRRRQVVASYLLTLMLDTSKRTQTLAGTVGNLHKSQFSRLLSTDGGNAVACLRSIGVEACKSAVTKKEPLVPGVKWTVAVIVDATIHPRSSLHVHNSQRFNHGQGFVIGHQWTNIVILINEKLIPLPPIAFLSKSECRRRKVSYKTEHEVLGEYLENLRLTDLIGPHAPDEVVVITDSGYDDKHLEQQILSRGWHFLTSLKSSRCAQTINESHITPKDWRRVNALFRAVRKHAPWATIRFKTDGGKKRTTFRARKLIGRIKGVHSDVSIICSEKTNGKGRRYFACTDTTARLGALMRVYRLRWQIELFHRAVKSQLGMLDAGVEDFESLSAHVHWVYCAWLLLNEIDVPGATSLLDKQRRLQANVSSRPFIGKIKKIVAAQTQFGGIPRQKRLVQEAIHEAYAM